MESIDRLRRYVECHDKITGLTATCINHLIDSIEKEVDDMWHALTIDAKPMTDENMAESGWVRLPVDADGVPIRVGDVMEWCQGGNVFTVTALHLVSREWEVWGDDAEYAPDECRHHHEPTVEDVLREFGDWYAHTKGGCDEDGIIAEYAAKLRLAGDGE